METIILYISLTGSFTCAISGALKAINKGFDPFGILIIGFVTAVGGGTLRDMLLTEKSVFWLKDAIHFYPIIAGVLIAILFKNKLNKFNKHLSFFDAVGLGLFTITGVQIGLEADLPSINCIILGTITGAFGGVLRDVLVNEIPLIFKKEVYATVSIAGGATYLILLKLNVPQPAVQIIPIVLMIVCRLLIIKFNVSLPQIQKEK